MRRLNRTHTCLGSEPELNVQTIKSMGVVWMRAEDVERYLTHLGQRHKLNLLKWHARQLRAMTEQAKQNAVNYG